MLLGKDAPIIFERGLRATHMEHVYDFYKPDLSSEYPVVDGKFSNICYLRSFDINYQRYMKKLAKLESIETPSQAVFDYFAFHSPYCKLVQKSVARMAYNDFLLDPENDKYASLKQFQCLDVDASREDKLLEKALVTLTKDYFKNNVMPSLHASQNIGNMYCAAVYSCLCSLISEVPAQNLLNKRIGVFSYGSGSAASLFSLRVVGSTAEIAKNLSLKKRLESRTRVTPEDFDAALKIRELTHNAKNYSPVGQVESVAPGTYYLVKVDAKFRRSYERAPQ
jgi:hydroxymethylglutaryl-CoA synthase